MLAQILWEQKILLRMRQLVPLSVTAKVLLVLSSKLLAVYAIVIGYALDALRCRLDPILLKKPQTRD